MYSLKNKITFSLVALGLSFGLIVSASASNSESLQKDEEALYALIEKARAEAYDAAFGASNKIFRSEDHHTISAKPVENSEDSWQKHIDKIEARVGQNPSDEAIGVDYSALGNYYKNQAYENEKNGNEQEAQKNYAIAFKWYQKLANLTGKQAGMTSSFGKSEIADMYRHGKGVQTNQAKAIEWYRKDCEESGTNRSCSMLDLLLDGVTIETPEGNATVNKEWVNRVTKFKQ